MKAPRALPYVRPVGVPVRNVTVPIWKHEMPSTAWQLLWLLICRMDEEGYIRGGWRNHAAVRLKRDRQWVGRCAEHLLKRELIETQPRARWCKVLTERLVG